MQIYGAQGRSQPENNAIGGKGGYSYGQLTLNKNQNIYICCGGSGEHGTNSGYNGAECTLAQYGGGWHGGGATHIATVNRGVLKNYSSYRSEIIMVAGGGGGAERVNGGDGGGLAGGKGTGYGETKAPTGGTQDAAGITYSYSGATIIQAAFGQGAIGHVNGDFGGNGGGGWYGGGAAAYIGGGAGGSGRINSSIIINGNMQSGIKTGDGSALITWMPVL